MREIDIKLQAHSVLLALVQSAMAPGGGYVVELLSVVTLSTPLPNRDSKELDQNVGSNAVDCKS